jgi:uncharacterized protein YhhL (DUF1145 family)
LKLAPALTLSQNPIFEMASNISELHTWQPVYLIRMEGWNIGILGGRVEKIHFSEWGEALKFYIFGIQQVFDMAAQTEDTDVYC